MDIWLVVGGFSFILLRAACEHVFFCVHYLIHEVSRAVGHFTARKLRVEVFYLATQLVRAGLRTRAKAT